MESFTCLAEQAFTVVSTPDPDPSSSLNPTPPPCHPAAQSIVGSCPGSRISNPEAGSCFDGEVQHVVLSARSSLTLVTAPSSGVPLCTRGSHDHHLPRPHRSPYTFQNIPSASAPGSALLPPGTIRISHLTPCVCPSALMTRGVLLTPTSPHRGPLPRRL